MAENNINETIVNAEINTKLKILIVDDDHYSLMLLKLWVKIYCRELIIAYDGNEAVLLCQNNPDIDLVLMDIRLPEIDGYEVTKKSANLIKKW